MKSSLKIIAILGAMFSSLLSIGQPANGIAPLFGLEAGLSVGPDFQSINQVNGETFFIETLDSSLQLNGNYAVDQFNNIVYYTSSPAFGVTIISSYFLPEFFGLPFTNSGITTTVSAEFLDFCFNHGTGLLYGYDQQFLYSMQPTNPQNIFPITLNSFTNYDPSSVSMVSDTFNLHVCGNVNGLNAYHHQVFDPFQGQLLHSDTSFQFNNIYLFSTAQFNRVYGIAIDSLNQHMLVRVNTNGFGIDTIGSLPSCTDCLTETVEYYKNAITIDWENEEMICVRRVDSAGLSTHLLATFSLTNGDLIRETSLSGFTSNLIFNKAIADLVFPGDANHDKLVDITDVLPIGLKYNDLTFARETPTTAWVGQFADNTLDTLANGVDKKHSDCNGDGQINALDIQSVLDNFNSIHNSEKRGGEDCDYQLYFTLGDSVFEGGEAEFQIRLNTPQDPGNDLYGLAFTVEFDSEFVVEESTMVEGLNSWFGVTDSNFITVKYEEHDKGMLHIAVTGIDKTNRSGGGEFIQGRWTMEDEVIPIADLSDELGLVISNVVAIDKDETPLDACGSNATMTVYDKSLKIDELFASKFEVYPVPANNHVSVRHEGNIEINTMVLRDNTGRTVTNIEGSSTLNVEQFSPGIYFLELNTNRGRANKKLVIK